MATVALGSKAVGSIVKLKVNGTLRDFIVVHQGLPSSMYDESCNGTWLLMKDIYENRQWHNANDNWYAESAINAYLNSTFLGLFEANIQAQIKQVKIPYRPSTGISNTVNKGANGLSCKVFLLSANEVGFSSRTAAWVPNVGDTLAYFTYMGSNSSGSSEKIANLNGNASTWWFRTPSNDDSGRWFMVTCCTAYGILHEEGASTLLGIRPAMILPPTLLVSDDGSITTNTAPTTPGSVTVPDSIQGGSTITVSWTASTDAQSNLEGYIVERSTDGGGQWTQIYQGSATSTTNTVAFGTASVMYRVRAYDSQGLYSEYRTSSAVAVINNTAPGAPGSITVPNTVLGGSTLTVTWGAASDVDGNLAGYSLERQVDGGAWAVAYTGNTLSYTDTITKGWAKVAYRVRAYDSNNAYSAYVTSPDRTVNNNTAPAITCAQTSGTDLGTKDSGFQISYSVGDVDSDTVTVTEAIDGVTKRTFTATTGTTYTFQVTGETFMKVLNGDHTLTITANDTKVDTVHKLLFKKEITAAMITLATPVEADAKIAVCVLSVNGSIPADANFKVEVTNNGKDTTPTWEDCTNAVKTGANHVFTNSTQTNGWAFNFKVTVSRGESGQGGYINSVQGGFQ